MAPKRRKQPPLRARKKRVSKTYPIEYWSHSSLLAFLRNPLAWYKRYVKKIYDTPRGPASIVGSAGHLALEHFYKGVPQDTAVEIGLTFLRSIPDFEIQFGAAKTEKAKRAKREAMEREYLQAIGFYLSKPPRHRIVGVEVKGMARVKGHPLPIKAISDLVVESRGNPGGVDIVDHKFVDSFSKGIEKPLYLLQAIFNYYTVSELYGRPVHRFIVYECKKRKNADGKPQMRRIVIVYKDIQESFELFDRLLRDATEELLLKKRYLPNPSDMFEGEHSFDLYRLRLIEED